MSRPLYAVIGGMGPMASAEFVNLVYKTASQKFLSERDFPRMIVASDPLAPDRKSSFEKDQFSILTKYIKNTISKLSKFNADKIIICCLVAHDCINRLDDTVKSKIVSIIDLLQETINTESENVLLLASPMLYEVHLVKGKNILLPQKQDIAQINEFIQLFKGKYNKQIMYSYLDLLEQLSEKYRINTFALACSDLHVAHKAMTEFKLQHRFKIIDSLELAANYIASDLGDTL